MKQITLGQKIKALRLEKKMTQADLAGDTITRNMLSQIENGVAQPSVSTILELADKLDVPTEYFFSESGTLDDFRKISAIAKIRKLYAAGDYGKCISKLDALNIFDDETQYIYARAAFAKGIELYRAGFLSGAMEYFQKAIEHGEKTVYLEGIFSRVVKRYLVTAEFVRSKEKNPLPEDCVIDKEADFKADIAYIRNIAEEDHYFDYGEACALYKEHLAIRAEMKKGLDIPNTETLVSRLKKILSSLSETKDAILQYYVLSDLETLSGRMGDYKCAYECSSARLALAEKMNH